MLNQVLISNAVIPVTKVKYTIKTIENNQVINTVDRSKLYEIHTPQVFQYELIYRYHLLAKKDHLQFTDDAAILEQYEFPVYTIVDNNPNIKITNYEDLLYCEYLIDNYLQGV